MPDPEVLLAHVSAHAHGQEYTEYLPQEGDTPYIVEEPDSLPTVEPSVDQTAPGTPPSRDESKY